MEIESRFPIAHQQAVDWGDQDALGHINNIVYFRYFENVRLLHFAAIGLDFPDPGAPVFGPILASTRCDFRSPITYPDQIRVEVGVVKLGKSSFTHRYRIHSQAQQRIVAEGESVAVVYNYAEGRSVPIPPEMRRRILELEGLTDGA